MQKTYDVPFNIPTDYVIPDERIVITLTESEEGTASGRNAATSSGGFQASGGNVSDGQWSGTTRTALQSLMAVSRDLRNLYTMSPYKQVNFCHYE